MAPQPMEAQAKSHGYHTTSSQLVDEQKSKVETHGSRQTQPYYWPHARGHVGHYSQTTHVGPINMTASLSWEWSDPDGRYHTTVVGGPLLDDEKSIYLAAEFAIRKFNKDGVQQWIYRPTDSSKGSLATCPSLMNGRLFSNTLDGWVLALDMATGEEIWAVKKADRIGVDTAYVESHDGVVVTGVNPPANALGGAQTVLGLDAINGSEIWRYDTDVVFWNVMAVFPGDDSFIVMDTSGGVHKHALHNSTLLWKSEPTKGGFTDGGVILGPDGTAYTCSNWGGHGQLNELGALRAYALKDGHMLWETQLEYPCNSWPVISLDGATVVVPTGPFVSPPISSDNATMVSRHMTREQLHNWSLTLGDKERTALGLGNLPAAIMAFDVQTGALKWMTELPEYGRVAAAGDEEGFIVRFGLGIRPYCLPAQFSSPTVAVDGTVYVGRADGNLYAVESGTGNYQTFAMGSGSLHPGTAFAPGLMAMASCDGLYVFNSNERPSMLHESARARVINWV